MKYAQWPVVVCFLAFLAWPTDVGAESGPPLSEVCEPPIGELKNADAARFSLHQNGFLQVDRDVEDKLSFEIVASGKDSPEYIHVAIFRPEAPGDLLACHKVKPGQAYRLKESDKIPELNFDDNTLWRVEVFRPFDEGKDEKEVSAKFWDIADEHQEEGARRHIHAVFDALSLPPVAPADDADTHAKKSWAESWQKVLTGDDSPFVKIRKELKENDLLAKAGDAECKGPDRTKKKPVKEAFLPGVCRLLVGKELSTLEKDFKDAADKSNEYVEDLGTPNESHEELTKALEKITSDASSLVSPGSLDPEGEFCTDFRRLQTVHANQVVLYLTHFTLPYADADRLAPAVTFGLNKPSLGNLTPDSVHAVPLTYIPNGTVWHPLAELDERTSIFGGQDELAQALLGLVLRVITGGVGGIEGLTDTDRAFGDCITDKTPKPVIVGPIADHHTSIFFTPRLANGQTGKMKLCEKPDCAKDTKVHNTVGLEGAHGVQGALFLDLSVGGVFSKDAMTSAEFQPQTSSAGDDRAYVLRQPFDPASVFSAGLSLGLTFDAWDRLWMLAVTPVGIRGLSGEAQPRAGVQFGTAFDKNSFWVFSLGAQRISRVQEFREGSVVVAERNDGKVAPPSIETTGDWAFYMSAGIAFDLAGLGEEGIKQVSETFGAEDGENG